MFYLLVFAMNIATFDPVVLKDCIEYHPKKDHYFQAIVDDFKKSGQRCEKSHNAISWTCTDNKTTITKALLMKDLKECKNFPQKTASDMKKLLGK